MSDPVQVGAFEIQGISGVSLASGRDAMGIRLACPHPALGLFDGHDILFTLDRPEVHAPDQSYVKYSWQVPVTPEAIRRYATWPRQGINAPVVCEFKDGETVRVTLEWSWTAETVVGRYSATGPIKVALIANGCFGSARVLDASAEGCHLSQGAHVLHLHLRGKVGEPRLADNRSQAEQAFHGLAVEEGSALCLFPLDLAPDSPAHFVMALGVAPAVGAVPFPRHTTIDEHLAAAARDYGARRMDSAGAFDGAAKAVAGLSGYSRAYDPERSRLQTTVNRTWGGPNRPGCVFGWDNFLMSYTSAWEDPALGAASLEHIVSVYGENGIPRGPVQRNLIIPLSYCRTLDVVGDLGLARRTWDTMIAFMRFWFSDRGDGVARRDGNRDGLIESGTDANPLHYEPGRLISEAMDETGYDDLPSYSAGFTSGRRGLLAEGVEFDRKSQNLTLTQIGQNSLYCAACRAMARWAERLGHRTDAQWLLAEETRVAGRIRDHLYSDRHGFYQDRFWSGGFSPVKTMTIFYPLLAGLGDANVRERLREILLDPKQFWGANVIPTVSRDDPAYCDGLDRRGNYWRGNCWPPTTYIVYLAIKEAGWDEIAARYAERTHAQFMRYWQRHGHAYENYPPEGEVDHRFLYVGNWGGREIRYVWSALMLLCGLEEIFAPEAIRPGIRFGNPHLARQSDWTRFTFGGVPVHAQAGPAATRVTYGGFWTFHAQPGVAVRGFHRAGARIDFTCSSPHAAEIRYRQRSRVIRPQVLVDGGTVEAAWQDSEVSFRLRPGEHAVTIEGPVDEHPSDHFATTV